MPFYLPSDLVSFNASDFPGTILRAQNQGLTARPLPE